MTFRLARHTSNLNTIVNFYVDVLNFKILGSFKNHNNYDGVFIGKENLDWHLEFTKSKHKANHRFDEDDILVFYAETKNEYTLIVKNIEKNNIEILTPRNPYWLKNGIYIKDPDGHPVIISDLKT